LSEHLCILVSCLIVSTVRKNPVLEEVKVEKFAIVEKMYCKEC